MKIEDIAIVGAGGFGKEVSLMIDIINGRNLLYKKVGFLDDNVPVGTIVGDLMVIDKIEALNNIRSPLNIVVAIGNPQIQKKINTQLSNKCLKFPNIIVPEVIFGKNRNLIGVGNIIAPGFILTCDISIGNYNIFNTGVAVGHDVTIGDFNIFNPNTQISGDVKIKDGNFFGVNACILQGIKIGSNNIIGAYSLLTRNVKDNNRYFGIPANRIK